jgi:FkbM family methyltransferase
MVDPGGLGHWTSVAMQAKSIAPVVEGIIAGHEYRAIRERSRDGLALFRGYSDADLDIIMGFRNANARAEPGFVVDFLGGRTRVSSLWRNARQLDGQLLGLPIPGDYHAEAPEWIGVLKSVRSAGESWVGMELGAGFGPWVVAGGNAARLRGITDIRLCAVEADAQHFEFLQQHFRDNGFDPIVHKLIHAAVGVAAGTALWPVIDDAREDWGLRPVPRNASVAVPTDYLGRKWAKTVPVAIVSMADLIEAEPVWSMVHIDVQGNEVEICQSCVEKLNQRVHWLIVGTHSRKLDGDMVQLMHAAGWTLENEKPCKFNFSQGATSLEAMILVDGIQVWSNPRFA